MKKVILCFLLTVILIGLSGCRTSRATVRTDAQKQLRKTEVADSSRVENTISRDQLSAVIESSEQKNVVIQWEEWQYYPATIQPDTTGQRSQQAPDFNRRTSTEADKPPNAGSLKSHKIGTITINADRQTEASTEQTSETATTEEAKGSREATIDEATKEKASTKQQDSKGRVWFYIGLACAVLLIATGIYLARRK